MQTRICKVLAQTEAVYVPSKKSDNGQLAKSMIRLKEFGGDYEDEFLAPVNVIVCAEFRRKEIEKRACKFSRPFIPVFGKASTASVRPYMNLRLCAFGFADPLNGTFNDYRTGFIF